MGLGLGLGLGLGSGLGLGLGLADCICAVHQGRIVERGTHDELLERKGMYYKLVKRQLQGAPPTGASFDEALDMAAATSS